MSWTLEDIKQYEAFVARQEDEFVMLYDRFGYRDLTRIIDMIDYVTNGCYDEKYIEQLFNDAQAVEATVNV